MSDSDSKVLVYQSKRLQTEFWRKWGFLRSSFRSNIKPTAATIVGGVQKLPSLDSENLPASTHAASRLQRKRKSLN
ncbi:MAG: hypothetical protein V4805_11950 [Pseudomonadota bacterium]